MRRNSIILTTCFTLALLLVLSGLPFAQEKFPARPISLIISWAPGGGGHINAQALQPHLEKALNQRVQIINKPGGGGTIGFNYLANSPPDGYTAGLINPSFVVTRYTAKSGVSYDKLDPLILTIRVPAGVFVRTDSPWKSFKELIDYARANPEKVQMGNSGHAAMYHVGIVGIEMATGVKFTHVPFKGAGPCVSALLGAHVDATLIEINAGFPYLEANKFRVLAVTSPERNFALPDVPTLKEYGFELDVGTWHAYALPKGTPKDRINILHDAFKVAIESEEFKALYKKQGGVVEYMGPEALAAYLIDQDKLWKKIIDFGGFKPIE